MADRQDRGKITNPPLCRHMSQVLGGVNRTDVDFGEMRDSHRGPGVIPVRSDRAVSYPQSLRLRQVGPEYQWLDLHEYLSEINYYQDTKFRDRPT